MSTRRQYRKNRPILKLGDTELRGEVIVFDQVKSFGFIKPDNGAARIHFSLDNVPHDRMKCVGIGRIVYFDVIQGAPIKRRKVVRPTITASIRSSRAG